MESFLKQIVLAKDMSLKNNRFIFLFVFVLFLNFSAYAKNEDLVKVINYLSKLDNFSVSFLQKYSDSISEGKISIGLNRVRVDYDTPTKILIILSDNKAMYYDYELDEDEFFDPEKTSAWFFFEIFSNLDFLLDSKLYKKNNNIVIEKMGLNDDHKFNLKIYMEENPIVLRKIELIFKGEVFQLSLFNHNYNEVFSRKFFKLINPNFFN